MKVRLIKVSDGLVPFDEEADKVISKLPKDAFVECDIKQPRNQNHHKKFFAEIASALFMIGSDLLTEDILDYIKEKMGRYRVVSVNGLVMKKYDTISFGGMSQPEFNIFYEQAVLILDELVESSKPDNQDLLDDVLEFAG